MAKQKKPTIKLKEMNSRIDINRIAISGGIFMAIILFLLTLGGKLFGLFSQTLNIFLDLFGKLGYNVSYFGIILSLVYGFVLGFILSWLYTYIYSRMPKSI